ncbi:hypothetical protein PV328_008265 [Microctonus aethiopoides]|uniref:Uncharacterized protein n=1 Tax=Microctonus aethiopoides TaxID=144406 RepID=A0AA39CAP2_9HYME|nr:hypothetical protein PV328_008265 [Microctonus aethiopoides]
MLSFVVDSQYNTINMKFLIVALAFIAMVAAQPVQPEPLRILEQSQDISPDGSFQYSFRGENGIFVEANGQPGQSASGEDGPPTIISGRFEYLSEDGTPIIVTYTADENGFHPEGDHLPTPHPIPEAIARSIELNAASSNVRAQREQPKNYGRRF